MTELETMQRAKMYMDMLAKGIDPVSGREIPEDSTLNNARLARCFSYVSDVLRQVIDNGGIGKVERKVEFSITPKQKANILLTAYPATLSEFLENIRRAAQNPDMKRPNGSRITKWLMDQGLMELTNDPEGKSRRLPTQRGLSMGLSTKMRSGQNGDYLAVYYDENIQRMILDHLEEILA